MCFFKLFATFSPLHFNIHFRIILLIKKKKPTGDLIRFISIDQFEKVDIVQILDLLTHKYSIYLHIFRILISLVAFLEKAIHICVIFSLWIGNSIVNSMFLKFKFSILAACMYTDMKYFCMLILCPVDFLTCLLVSVALYFFSYIESHVICK